MSLAQYIRRYIWRIFPRVIFYVSCGLGIYFFYRWSPTPIRPLHIVHHSLPKPISPPALSIVESYYQVFINGIDTNTVVLFFKDKQGRLWVSAKELEAWRLIKPNAFPITYNGEAYYSLSQFPGMVYAIDQENMAIKLNFPAHFFKVNHINLGGAEIYDFKLPSPGAFFNYNLLDTRQAGPKPDNQFIGLFQVGVFNSYGVGNTSFINQNAWGTETFLRLNSTWRYDDPAKMWTLSVGDDISAMTNWSSSVNYGGVQWGTNFNTQPTFVTFPQLGFKGQATVPSTLDLFLNNSLSGHQSIMPGPYDISNIPYVDGYGNVRIVTKDSVGRQQVVVIPFYASTQLLKPGLKNYTYEFGMIRQNLGSASFDYARFLAAATYAVGLSDHFTFQGHIEGLSDQQTAGLEAFRQLGTLGILNGGMAVSHINAGNRDGGLLLAGFQRLTNSYSFSVNSQITTLYFTQQGLEPGQLSPRLTNQINAGTMLGANNFSCSYIRQINRNALGNNMILLTYSRNVFFNIAMSISGERNLGGTPNKGIFLTFTRGLGGQTSGSIFNSVQNDVHQESIQLTRSLPPGPGYGYTLMGSTGSANNNKLGSVSLQNDVGTYQGDIFQNNGQTRYSLNVQGGAVYIGGQSYLTRNLQNNSFAVVQTPGFSNVDVYLNNQLTARTDKNGNALVPNLLPYQKTALRIDPATLPLDANIEETSQAVAPYYSSGVLVPFAVNAVQGATLTLKQTSGAMVPEGAAVTLQGQTEEYAVASDGQTYVSHLQAVNNLDVRWEGHHCKATFSSPPADPTNPIPDLGILICREVTNAEE